MGALGFASSAAADTVFGPTYPLPGYTTANSHGGSSCKQTGGITTANLVWSFGSNPSTTAPEAGTSCADSTTPPAFDPTRFQALYWGLDLTSDSNNYVSAVCVSNPCTAGQYNSGGMTYDATDSHPTQGVLVYQGKTTTSIHLTLTFKDGAGNAVSLTDATTLGPFKNSSVDGSKLGYVVAVTPQVTNFTVSAAYNIAIPSGNCGCHTETHITGGFYYADLPPGGSISPTTNPPLNHTSDTFRAVNLTDPYSADDGAAALTYSWDLSGGTTYGQDPNADASSSYGPGAHTVALQVTDADGVSTRVEYPFTITNQPPTGSIAVVSPGTDPPTNRQATTFHATVSDPDQGTDGNCANPTYSWDLAGGTTYGADANTDAVATFTPGQHTIAILVTDCDGATQRIEKTFTVTNQPPTGSITMTPDPALNHQPVMFQATGVSDPDQGSNPDACAAPTYAWDLSGGTNFVQDPNSNATATFGPGQHTVALQITDCDGGTFVATKTFTIVNQKPVVSFSCTPSAPFARQSVTCTASDRDPDAVAGDPPLTEVWTVGTTHHTGHTFTFRQPAGKHTVSLSVTDRDGGRTTVSKSLTFLKPVATVAITPKQTLASAFRQGIRATFKGNEAFTSALTLTVSSAKSRTGKTITITGAVGTAKPALAKAGSIAFTVPLTSTAKQKLAKAKTVTFVLKGVARDKFGNAVPIRVAFTLS